MQFALIPSDLTPSTVLDALRDCVGSARGRSASDLVASITGRRCPADERRLRQGVEALRPAGHRVCADPAHGYRLAADDAEPAADGLDGLLHSTCLFLYGRAMTSLRQVSAMKRVALPDLRGQLRLPITEKPDDSQ
mgnify:CR=1 FL=1